MKSKNKYLIIAISCFSALFCQGQKITIIKATAQKWSGGVPGNAGTYYNIELQTSDYHISLDTLWVNGNIYPLNFSGAALQYKRKVDSLHHKITYSISVEENRSERMRMPPNREDINVETPENEKPKPVKHYEGVALITYQYKYKQHSFVIKQFSYLEPINYP